jgi:hypothetical protein
MTAKTRAAYQTDVYANIIDNSTGLTSNAKVRQRMIDHSDSSPFFGEALPAGFSATTIDAGTKSSGTFTPDPALGNVQKAVNGGAHTLAPPATDCCLLIKYTNNASAGAITSSGFTLAEVTALTTTNGHVFFFYISRADGTSLLTVKRIV